MIEFVKGRIEKLDPAQVVIETAGGVGYLLNISLNTYSAIQNSQEAKLYVNEAIREDAYVLYGFADRRERELFLLLISVPGIGGASARMILSAFSPSELENIISTGDERLLKQVKGIGLKTAQRIIVDLKDKMRVESATASCLSASIDKTASENIENAVAALTMLGFQQSQSLKTVQSIIKENPDFTVEAIIKEALKRI
ncbi:MAG: Holliday junction branch migration protein RuvA [Bacteroidaceae bacterium]|nr:Holliday junction branch migration protein RuvA [Bacteroidaceae bacterium]